MFTPQTLAKFIEELAQLTRDLRALNPWIHPTNSEPELTQDQCFYCGMGSDESHSTTCLWRTIKRLSGQLFIS